MLHTFFPLIPCLSRKPFDAISSDVLCLLSRFVRQLVELTEPNHTSQTATYDLLGVLPVAAAPMHKVTHQPRIRLQFPYVVFPCILYSLAFTPPLYSRCLLAVPGRRCTRAHDKPKSEQVAQFAFSFLTVLARIRYSLWCIQSSLPRIPGRTLRVLPVESSGVGCGSHPPCQQRCVPLPTSRTSSPSSGDLMIWNLQTHKTGGPRNNGSGS